MLLSLKKNPLNARSLSLFLGSVNEPMIKYVPVRPSHRPSIFTREGWQERLYRLRLLSRYIYGRYRLYRVSQGFSKPAFLAESKAIYRDFWESFSIRQDPSRLRDLVTESLYATLKKRIGKGSPSLSSSSSLVKKVPEIVKVELVDLLVCEIPIMLEPVQICQVAVKFVLQGQADPHYIVFERPLNITTTRGWRICARIYESNVYYLNDNTKPAILDKK